MNGLINKKNITKCLSLIIVYVILFILINSGALNPYYAQILILFGINIILAVSLNMVIGFTGQLALGHAGFMSIGAYTAAVLTMKLGLPFPVVLIVGGLVAALFGYLIGTPILRLKGDYLAITTLGFGEIIRVLIVNLDYVGGPRGLPGIPKKTTFTWVFIITVLSVVIMRNIIKSAQGRAMVSIREDEIAAEAMGINTTSYKLKSFVIAAFFAGIAGGLYAHYFMYLDPKSFNFLKSIEILTFVVLGGMGSISGSIIGSGTLTALPEVLRSMGDFRMIIYPACLILLMLFRPQGLLGTKEISLDMIKGIFKRKKTKTK
jgi:branched-chain amino acid transport system permease protein